MRKIKEEKRGTNVPLPPFIYTPKDSRVRFLAPKHTSRLLFLSEVPHSTESLGDRTEASVYATILYMIFHTWANCARKVHICVIVKTYANIWRTWLLCDKKSRCVTKLLFIVHTCEIKSVFSPLLREEGESRGCCSQVL